MGRFASVRWWWAAPLSAVIWLCLAFGASAQQPPPGPAPTEDRVRFPESSGSDRTWY